MKRSAAILGPTPAFLRWTIVASCPFRDPAAKSPPDAAFRELRSLRAIAVGEYEDRIVDGICLHPDAVELDPAKAKGFPVDEVYAAYGGKEAANATCRKCMANVPICGDELDQEVKFSKGGCFGWLPFGEGADGARTFSRLMVGEQNPSPQPFPEGEGARCILNKFESAMQSVAEPCPFLKTTPKWYGVWSVAELTKEQLEFLNLVCGRVESASIAWRRLARAVKVAFEEDLRFVCALTPPGHSDGVHWTIESQCSSCGAARANSPCTVCGAPSPPQASRKMKVLGLRPYLNLSSIVGEDATVAILERYRDA